MTCDFKLRMSANLITSLASFRVSSDQNIMIEMWNSDHLSAATFLLTIWYKRYEVQGRMAIFYAAASLSGAFSGLLAYAIEEMNGISGLGGWQWYTYHFLISLPR